MSKWMSGKYVAARAMVSLVMVSALWMPLAGAQSAVREVPTSNRVAGTVGSGWNFDSGTATNAKLSAPSYTAFDKAGNLYIADTGNNCVRKVDTAGNITVAAGLVQGAGISDTCNAASATPTAAQGVYVPTGLAVDSIGNLFIADSGHNCVRELPIGSTGTASLVPVVDTCLNTTLTSVSPTPSAIYINGAGNLGIAIADATDNISQVIAHVSGNAPTSVCLLAGQGSANVSTFCPGVTGGSVTLNLPRGLAIDPLGNGFVADTGNNCIRELSTAGVVSTYLGQCLSDSTGTPTVNPDFNPIGLVFGAEGYLYIANGDDTVLQYRGPPSSLALPWAGIVYTGSQVPPPYTGTQEGIAAVDVSLNHPIGLAVDNTGNVYVADSTNGIVRQLALGTEFPAQVLHNSGTPQTLQFEIDAAVNLTVGAAPDFPIFSGNNTCAGALVPAAAGNPPTTCSVTLQFQPLAPGLRRSPLTLTDTSANVVYRFGTSGIGLGANALFTPGNITTKIGSLATPSAVVVSTTGDTYFAEQGTGPGTADIQLLPAGGSTASVYVAPGGLLNTPSALALDSAQNLYIADSAANAIYQVNAAGVVSTVASGLNDPVAVAVDTNGNLLVEQNGSGAVELIKIFAGGQQIVLAGQGSNTAPNNVPATTAQFSKLSGLYLDSGGNIFLSDEGALRVYEINGSGTIVYFAGNGTTTTTDNTNATATALLAPAGLVGDAAGDIYIADSGANLLYVVFGGSNQNPGIEQLAGTGTAGGTGDNGPANLAELNNPVSVSLDSSDNVYLIDAGNSSLREISYINPTLNFGVVDIGVTKGPLTTTLWDAGNQPLNPLTTFQPVDSTDFKQVYDGCGGTLQVGSTCQLSFTFTASAQGSYNTTASSSANAVDIPQVINLIAQTPVVTKPDVTAVYGDNYTLALSLTAFSGNPVATGTATFSIAGVDVCTSVAFAGGTVTCSPSPTLENVGTYVVTVTYPGDNNFPPATYTLSLTITPRPVTITANDVSRPFNTPNPALTGTIANVVAGQSITVSGYTTTAVQSSPVGTYPIVPTPPAIFGANTLASNYTVTFVNGTLTVTQTGPYPSTLTAPNVSAVYGTPYMLSATVIGGQTTAPTGTVTFSIGGVAVCPPAPVLANAAACSPSPTLENVGTYTVTAVYSGDTVYTAQTATFTLTITPAPVTITANSFTRPYNTPNPVLTGTITGVVAGQSITATYTTTAVQASPVGTYPIVPVPAAGPGTLLTNYAITLVDGTLTITSVPAAAVTITAPNVTAVYGTPYTLAATVTGNEATAPTGNVTFSIAGATLCPAAALPGNGAISCAPSPTLEPVGTYTVTVSYAGDGTYPAATATFTLTITLGPVVGSYSLTATPPEQEIDKTGGVNYTIVLTSLSGFTDGVNFTCSGLPAGATCSFAPGILTPTAGGTATTVMTVDATADGTNVPSGSHGQLQPQGLPTRAPSTWLAWTMLPLGFGSGATTLLFGRRRRKQPGSVRRWIGLLIVPVALLLAGLGGCASAVQYKIYTVTVTATDTTHPDVSQSTTVQLTLAR